MQTAKIVKSSFKKEYASPNGVIYYHDVTTEGETKPWNIGSKEKAPNFLSVGAILNFEVEDAAKRKIKRVKAEEEPAKVVGVEARAKAAEAPKDTYTKKQDAVAAGMMVGNALTNASLLVAHGIVPIADLKKFAHRICEISTELKEEFGG